MTEACMQRISELTRISRTRELTLEEQTERAALRQAYIAEMTGSLRHTIEHTTVIGPNGKKRPLAPQKPTDGGNP